MVKLSVVVHIYNVEDYLAKSLDSIMNQTFSDFECIMVNDGTKDNSDKIALEYQNKDRRFKLLNKANGGLSDARNAGMAIAKGKYIYFADSDDFLELDLFEKCIAKLEATDSDMVIFDVYQYYLKTNSKEIIRNKYDENKVYNLKDNKDIICNILNAAWNKMYKRSLFTDNNIIYPFGCYYEDLGTTYRLLLKCKKIAFVNEALYNYLVDRPGNITSAFNFNVYHVLDMVKITCDYYKEMGVYDDYYEELKFLAGINILECLKKTRNCDDQKMVEKYIDVCFFDINNNFPEFPKCKYQILRQKNDWIYAHKNVLKFYLRVRKLWH